MQIQQIVTEGEYEKGRLVGIIGHWEDGAALMWNTEMMSLGLTPFDDAQWNTLTDSKGNRLQGTKKSIIGGIWLKWKKPLGNGLIMTDDEKVAPVQAAPETTKNLRGMIGGLVSAAGQAAKVQIIAAAAEAKKNLVLAADERARTERERLEREGGGKIALRLVNVMEAATKAAREQLENKPTPLQNDAAQSDRVGDRREAKETANSGVDQHQPHPNPLPGDNARDSDTPAMLQAAAPAAPPNAVLGQPNAERDAAVAGIQAALDGGGACVLPFALLSEWTDGFGPARRIGGGAFGDVYEAAPPALPRLAVKRLAPGVRMQGAEEDLAAALACFRREVAVLGAFRHPNIIRLLGYTDAAGAAGAAGAAHGRAELCLAYELAPRGGLDDALRSDGAAADLTWRVRVRVAAGVARALNFMHCHDPAGPAFHRDVKSANVALMLDLTPKLIDCGLAKYAPDGRPGPGTVLSAAGARLGTPGYKCPAYERTGVFTARSEVYSYGVLLLELLTGRLQADVDLCADFVEADGDVLAALDGRAGAWEPACAAGAAELARECAAPPARRLGGMMPALRRAAELEARFCARTREEDGLARQVAELQAGLEALRAQQAQADRAVRAAAEAAAAAARRTCRVCFDDLEPAAEGAPPPGIDCPARGAEHFVCGGCFGLEVREQASPGARGAFAASGARAVCRLCLPARTAYADGALARALDDDGFALYRRAVVEASTAAVYQEVEARLQRCIAEVRAEAARDGAGERARRHRLHIAEHILCLHCPRCGQAFVDFAGCFALTCSRCACGFCAYCLADCGDDAHTHVAACAFNAAPGRDVFGTPELFQRAQNERRARALAAYLAEHVPDEAERAAVRASIAGELAGLGMVE
jgi:hypothetical protein